MKTCLRSSLLVLVAVSPVLSGCSIIGLHGHVRKLEDHGTIAVQVSPLPESGTPTYALAWRREDGRAKDSAGFQRVRPDGLAVFHLLADQAYSVGAFTDANGNNEYDAGEMLGYVHDVKPAAMGDPEQRARMIRVEMKRDHGLPPGTLIRVPKANDELGGATSIALGDIASVDESHFAPETGSGGLWRPLDFLRQNRTGIYFTEPYDPKRIPVVFVYGIGGSPQDWRYVMAHLDRTRYQVWFFHYPSGMRLAKVSHTLALGLDLLRQRHGFAKCYLVAHSMGGLVSRAAICEAVSLAGRNFVPEFVSVSTPWGGHKAAESGIRYLRKPVPSWIDVAPGSEFLLGLYDTPLPKGTTHHLIYGSIEGEKFWMNEPNDGIVTVASETDPRVVRNAASIRHLFREHVEILDRPETLKLIERGLRPGE